MNTKDEHQELIRKLFQSIEETFLTSERIQNSIEELKSKGVELDLAVAVLLCLGKEKTANANQNLQKNLMNLIKSENEFKFNDLDKEFLKSIGINPYK